MSDTAILATIVIIFVTLGAILPFIHATFDQQETNFNVEDVEFESGQSLLFSEDQVTVLGVVASIFTMFFWTFGAIPIILEIIIFLPMRIIFVVLLYKLVRGVGG